MRLRKELGQHLLVDRKALHRIARAAEAGETDLCVEIGPGTGNLTRELLTTGARVTAVELDERMAEELAARFKDEPLLKIVRGDILKVDPSELVPPGDAPAIAVGNLPYYISSPIVFRLLEFRDLFSRIVVMVQEEVGERMCASPGSRAFGMLSVFCQVEAECKLLFRVGRDSFRPPPDVDSCVVSLEPLPPGTAGIEDRATFDLIVHGLFEHRRKTCYNSMRMSMGKGACRELLNPAADVEDTLKKTFAFLGVDAEARAETLDVATFVAIANHFHRLHS
jgi:16S rRNA (adenine1518-N6/adenine1519-N6)-dimethyltransferase